MENLKAAVFALINRVEAKAKEFNLGDNRVKDEVENIYVRQIDYTQDLMGSSCQWILTMILLLWKETGTWA